MKLLKKELWAGVISEAGNSIRAQVDLQVNWQVYDQVDLQVDLQVSLPVSDQILRQVNDEMGEGERK